MFGNHGTKFRSTRHRVVMTRDEFEWVDAPSDMTQWPAIDADYLPKVPHNLMGIGPYTGAQAYHVLHEMRQNEPRKFKEMVEDAVPDFDYAPNKCLIWNRPTNKSGRPHAMSRLAVSTGDGQRVFTTARTLLYFLHYGVAVHLRPWCKNKACVNPLHQWPPRASVRYRDEDDEVKSFSIHLVIRLIDINTPNVAAE